MDSKPRPSFELVKTYMDCVDASGNCFIVYWARLRIGIFMFRYVGYIFSDEKNNLIEKSSLCKTLSPEINDNLTFKNNPLNISGTWGIAPHEYSSMLYQPQPYLHVFWNCHHPSSFTEIELNGKKFSGQGYAETLSFNIQPWLLPIDELRWGRALFEGAAVIWINWKGAYPLNKIYWNGKEYSDVCLGEDKITFNNNACCLKFSNISVIREGKLTKVLSKMPWMKLLFNARILNSVEVKYKAHSSFVFNNESPIEGWSIYEIVTWKK